jgi:hypothetical protein
MSDLPNVEHIDFYSINRIKKLFYIHFEIGGKNKTTRQIRNLTHAYLALDGIATGFRNEIPLWLFGMLY